MSPNKIAIVTAVTGGKDRGLSALTYRGVDSFMYTDDVHAAARLGWQPLRAYEFSNLSRPDRRNAKLPKILPFVCLPDYNYVIWQDGGHQTMVHPEILINKYLIEQDKDVAAFQHGRAQQGQDHNCIYKEAWNIKGVGFLEDAAIIDEQVAAYKADGYPENYGLSCNAGMIWRNTPKMWRLQLTWWEQVCRYSSRDQMSFFYAMWKTDTVKRFTYIDGHWERNDEIQRICGHADAGK